MRLLFTALVTRYFRSDMRRFSGALQQGSDAGRCLLEGDGSSADWGLRPSASREVMGPSGGRYFRGIAQNKQGRLPSSATSDKSPVHERFHRPI